MGSFILFYSLLRFKDNELLNTRTSIKHRSRIDGNQVKLVVSNVQMVDVGKYKFAVDSLNSPEAMLSIKGKVNDEFSIHIFITFLFSLLSVNRM